MATYRCPVHQVTLVISDGGRGPGHRSIFRGPGSKGGCVLQVGLEGAALNEERLLELTREQARHRGEHIKRVDAPEEA